MSKQYQYLTQPNNNQPNSNQGYNQYETSSGYYQQGGNLQPLYNKDKTGGISVSSVCIILGAVIYFIINVYFIINFIVGRSQIQNFNFTALNATFNLAMDINWTYGYNIIGIAFQFLVIIFGLSSGIFGVIAYNSEKKIYSIATYVLAIIFTIGTAIAIIYMSVPNAYLAYYGVRFLIQGGQLPGISGAGFYIIGTIFVALGGISIVIIVLCLFPYTVCGCSQAISFFNSARRKF